jgi:hypothetical protein
MTEQDAFDALLTIAIWLTPTSFVRKAGATEPSPTSSALAAARHTVG